ncbi:MAG: hypothetical protein OQK29_01410 [Ignavibacteriaceae bacterium]|nr:hypothetical protein [Ignavibacteriaceae bacterium]
MSKTVIAKLVLSVPVDGLKPKMITFSTTASKVVPIEIGRWLKDTSCKRSLTLSNCDE